MRRRSLPPRQCSPPPSWNHNPNPNLNPYPNPNPNPNPNPSPSPSPSPNPNQVLAAADLEPAAERRLEPAAAEQRLFDLCQGRRLSGWTAEERPTVDALVEELVALGRQTPWSRHSP